MVFLHLIHSQYNCNLKIIIDHLDCLFSIVELDFFNYFSICNNLSSTIYHILRRFLLMLEIIVFFFIVFFFEVWLHLIVLKGFEENSFLGWHWMVLIE